MAEQICPYGAHSDHDNRIDRNETDIQTIMQSREVDREIRRRETQRIHDRIDAMKNWVIAGMGSMMLYFGVAIFNFVMKMVD